MSRLYNPDEILALSEAVQRDKGARLPDKCSGTIVEYPVPGSDRLVRERTCACDFDTMFVARYDPSDDKAEAKKMQENGAGFARVCAECDMMGAWPKFEHALKEN